MSAEKDKGQDVVAGYVRKITWILLTLVILGLFSYFRMSGQLAQFVEGMRSPSKPTVSQKAETTITITKDSNPRMIDYPYFSRFRSGIVENDVAYVIHINLVGRPDHEIEKILVPARNDRPSNWSDPLAGKNIARIGFTLDPSSAKDIGHIEYVIDKQ